MQRSDRANNGKFLVKYLTSDGSYSKRILPSTFGKLDEIRSVRFPFEQISIFHVLQSR